jgi:hypothetical protein
VSFSAEIAPVVDRLVLAVNTVSRAESKDRIAAHCARVGVDSPEFPGHYAEFLLAGRLTEDLAVARLHYQPPERILGAVTGWERAGLTIRTGDRLAAGPELGGLAEAILEERRVVATRMWSGHADLVDTANRIISGMLALLPAHFALAVEHAALPAPHDPYRRLHQQLTTMRYVRSQCHAEAWRAGGLHRDDIVAMTALWHGATLDTVPQPLLDRGLAADQGLTDQGLEMRRSIEDDTNAANEGAFDSLGAAARISLSEALNGLPGEPI